MEVLKKPSKMQTPKASGRICGEQFKQGRPNTAEEARRRAAKKQQKCSPVQPGYNDKCRMTIGQKKKILLFQETWLKNLGSEGFFYRIILQSVSTQC